MTSNYSIVDVTIRVGKTQSVLWARQLRIRWFAAYRAHLLGKKTDWRVFEKDLPDRSIEGGWLHNLSRKYRCTLRATTGNMNGGKADIDAAVSLPNSATLLFQYMGTTAVLHA